MKKKWIALFLIAVMLLTAGCASSNKAKMDAAAPAAAEPMMAESIMEAPMAMEEAAYDATMSAAGASIPQTNGAMEKGGEPNYGGRKIIRQLALELSTDRFDEHVALIKKDTQTAGGYVQDSYVYGTKPEVAGDSGRNANFTLRIPIDQVDAFINTASGYGTLLSQNENSEDVTDSYFDIETRLEVNRTTLERLKSILVQTNKLSDIIELEQEIARVTIEIEDLTTKLRKYDGLIEYARVSISLYEEGMKIGPAAKTPFGQRVSDGFSETLSGLCNFLEDLAVVLLSALPLLIPIALIVWLVLWLRKKNLQKDIENGMPENFAAWQRRAWKRDRRLAKKNGVAAGQPVQTPQNGEQEAPKDENK